MGGFMGTATDTNNKFVANNPYNTAASMATAQRQAQQIYDQQQALAGQLQTQAGGQGPSASQTMLGTAMNNNAANQNAMAMGQRGINPGLAMRQAGQNATQNNMQMTAQGVAARQQEQATAQGELGSLYNGMGNNNSQQQGLISGAQSSANQINAGVQYGNQQNQQKLVGGGLNGISSMAGSMGGNYKGGMIQKFANGGMSMPQMGSQFGPSQTQAPMLMQQPNTGGSAGLTQPAFGSTFTNDISAPSLWDKPEAEGNSNAAAGAAGFFNSMGSSMGSGNTQGFGLPPVGSGRADSGPSMMQTGAKVAPLLAMKAGGRVPGQPMVPGNSPKNDTVPSMLSPKEIVIPNSITTGKNAPQKAKEFVAALLARNGMKK